MKYSFIGLGAMAEAIIRGIKAAQPEADIFGYDPSAKRCEVMSEYVHLCSDAQSAAESAPIVFMAVKPNVLGSVLDDIKFALSGRLVVSIAAGKSLDFIKSHLSSSTRVIRVMPNLGAAVGAGSAAVCASEGVTDDEKQAVLDVFAALGAVIELDEALFPVFSGIAACSPAFTFEYIDSLALAGVRGGISYDKALKAAAASVMGAAKLVLERLDEEHPMALLDRVCSPGGTTIEGVMSLRKNAFSSAVAEAVAATVEKDKSL